MKVYYAHSMRIYNSQRERQEVHFLRLRLHQVTNPNGLLSRYGWKDEARKLIFHCDAIMVSEYREHIGKGVYTEIHFASAMHKPVFVLRDRELVPITLDNVEIVDPYDWKVRYAKIV